MFKERSKQQELLDGEVQKSALVQNLKELHNINSLLGGYTISTSALKRLNLHNKTIVDIGSGGGDMVYKLYQASPSNTYYGVDIKEDCISYAQEHLPPSDSIQFICSDYRDLNKYIARVDVLHACLFTHHLSNDEIIVLIKFATKQNSTLIINDLHRSPIAYYSIKFLTRIFSKSSLVKHDAPLSVLRSFKRSEWEMLLSKAGAKQYTIHWRWAFRYLIVVHE